MELLTRESHSGERLLVKACGRHRRQLAGCSQCIHVRDELPQRRTDAGGLMFCGVGARSREKVEQLLLAGHMKRRCAALDLLTGGTASGQGQ